MVGLKKVGKYLFLEAQENTLVGISWRAAELANGRVAKNYLVDAIDPRMVAATGFLDHYLNQSMVSSKLEHPNILKRVNTLHEGGEAFAIYEHLEGFSLARVLERCQSDGFPFSIDHALLVVSKLLSALSYSRGKHVSHGFVNPSMLLITHEGEVKVKGFALSAAIHASPEAVGALDPAYQYYLPQGSSLSGNRDRNDIYACGAILYEMLTGEKFNQAHGDPASIIAGASMEADGEQIPTQIANILVSSLDTSAPTAYKDTQKMSADLEELLYSGEYSPTTFNLAFFMHSAFREEMEALGEKIAAEKERDFSDMGTSPGMAASKSTDHEAAPPPRSQQAAMVDSTLVDPPIEKKKSPMGMILAIVAVVIVLGVGGFLFMGRNSGGGSDSDTFAAEQSRLQENAKKLEEDRLRQQQDELAQQNELLRQQLMEQRRIEEERKKQQILEDMQKMDEEIARIKNSQAQEAKQKEIADQLAILMKEKEDIAARMRKQEEDEKVRQAEIEAAAKQAERKKAEEAAKAAQASEESPDSSMPAEPPSEEVTIIPPREGDLVPLDDPYLQFPQILESYSTQDAPKKAVRAGVVPKGKTITFLMRALVNEKGDVEEVVLHRSPLEPGQDDFEMVSKAEKVAAKARFAPGTKHGVKVKVWMIVSVSFQGK